MFVPFNNNIFRNTFFLIILAEILSFLGYYHPLVNCLVFFMIVILTIAAALYRLEYGLYILFAELFIGSFGYLFYCVIGGNAISVRLALWLIIMSVWLAKIIIAWMKQRKISADILKLSYFNYFAVLGVFVIWGLLNGFINGNSPSNIFFDFNNWLYFLLIFPAAGVLNNNENLKIVKRIFFAAIAWLSLKTILLAYFFSHNFNGFAIDLYRWVRQSGVGEITAVQIGFSRIFMQSHIFVLIGFFIFLFYLLKTVTDHAGREKSSRAWPIKALAILTLLLSIIIISFSRSFWIGLAAGGIAVWLIALFKLKIELKQFVIFNSLIFLSLLLSLALILGVIKFPYPKAYGGFNPADLLSQRATQITSEAGASSRWQLLPALWQKIKISPIMGRGFGATVTYKTSDPRVLASNPGGLYTTYAFEWGWLDVWLKLGLFGLLVYLSLFFKIIKDGLRVNSHFSLSLVVGLIVLMAVNIFSPYINHPLGIGYIVLAIAIMENIKTKPKKL